MTTLNTHAFFAMCCATSLIACGTDSASIDAAEGQNQQPLTAISFAERELLNEDFPVYVRGNTVIKHPAPGFQKHMLPTKNNFMAAPGCYIVCYTHDSGKGVYGVSSDVFVAGQVRVAGNYVAGICVPTGTDGMDISATDSDSSAKCSEFFPATWAGGDTGGWFQ